MYKYMEDSDSSGMSCWLKLQVIKVRNSIFQVSLRGYDTFHRQADDNKSLPKYQPAYATLLEIYGAH